MNPISKKDASLLERFVSKFQELADLDFFPDLDPVAKQLSVGTIREFDQLERWRPIQVTTDLAALDSLYQSLPGRLPKLFEHLLLHFRWAEVDLDLYTLSPNPPGNDLSGWLAQASRDKVMWPFLLRAGYIPFGKGPHMHYDQICFETKSRKKGDECRIVQIDHEEVLCNERLKVVREIAPTFRSLVEQTIAREKRI